MNTNVRSLIAKLNDATRSALEAAAGLCLSRTHYDIEIEHLLMKLLDPPVTDVPIILKQFALDQ
jgi:type VI secretion system protein VasG